MLKLYNIFQEVILEETALAKSILTESASIDDVQKAIDGKYIVEFKYQDYQDQPPSTRWVQIDSLSMTKGNNMCIRAYQVSGGSKTVEQGWKIFLLNKIISGTWKITNYKWNKFSYGFNPNGDNTMNRVIKKVKI
jgi:hypothetical protein